MEKYIDTKMVISVALGIILAMAIAWVVGSLASLTMGGGYGRGMMRGGEFGGQGRMMRNYDRNADDVYGTYEDGADVPAGADAAVE